MQIQTFRAASLQEALDDIRRELGDDASVLHTRQVREGWMGWLGRTSVEVTAGIRAEATPTGPRPENRATDRLSTRFGYPLELQDLRDLLTLAGVEGQLANRWIEETYSLGSTLSNGVEPGQWIDGLRQTVARGIRIAGPIQCPPGERRVVALVGPTGVGKTTTIAKLAAGFRFESRRNVALLTVDTFRIAAVDQLQAYADVMGLPMEVVQDPGEMRGALERLSAADLVLVDTVGRSPRSESRIQQLKQMLDSAGPNETHLVLSATSSRETILGILEGFAAVRPTATILTKLDETPQLAGVLGALAGRELAISYLTTGQQVPDDIEPADRETLVSNLLFNPVLAVPLSVSVRRQAA
ncbi:MAG: flagellar biosynthesis protein FlhF [Planctomycetaceae bacterium]|nr:MAG: flagellar biosynthesis protein FlhF [Planctomycetaceae bacterium]